MPTAEELKEMINNGKDVKEVHLYNADNILRPRGAMKKESLSLYIYEKLLSAFCSWGNPTYADSILDQRELLRQIQINLREEVEVAVDTFLEKLRIDGIDFTYKYK